ncbi:hypothetical protein Pint_13277 [Pistacia integerrima]|uniref:Uncharacterized protein n=1 Tax=Pistacia integerrima TaxID=434235 RepID=A0ACC0Y6Q9_9ROSI|nr:hypothetical protein Pint_13277 [Pistacia integerrima]
MGMNTLGKARSISSVFGMKSAVQCCALVRGRSFSSSYLSRVGEGGRDLRVGKSRPWLKLNKSKEAKGFKKVRSTVNIRSSWEESAERLQKGSSSYPSWEESAKRLDKVTTTKISHSSWEGLPESSVQNIENRNLIVGKPKNYQNGHVKSNGNVEEEEKEAEVEVEGDVEVVEEHRWDRKKNMFRGDRKVWSEKPEFRRWNKQENLERRTWKEPTESTVPKMVGEGLYGVGPVLAALSSVRREFYALYVQEGLSLSSNNRKRKDKKGFEKVLKMAKNIGISIKETSKHDLNMVADNRPHQGLVLDASPLEMVKIKELDPVSIEEDQTSLWVALDEVTDPQNMGAIIRSAYFFGASGVVLCAKNSAPLSGVVSKASAGSLELMELRYCNNMMQFLISSAENGWRVLGGSVSPKAIALNEIPPGPPTILVLGSEGTGLRPLVERSCTHLVKIPGNIPVDVTAGVDDMASDEQFRSFMAVESLNVSVAAGVLLHYLIGHQSNDNRHIADISTSTHD